MPNIVVAYIKEDKVAPYLEALAAVAQSGLAPKAPAALPPNAPAVPGSATVPTAAGVADPVMGIVLLAIGLAGAYGFGAVDRQRRRRPK